MSKLCPFCGTYSNSTSPKNCKDEKESAKCGWNIKPKKVNTPRPILGMEKDTNNE